MTRKLKRIRSWINAQWLKIKPGKQAVKGASRTLLGAVVLCWLIFSLRLVFGINDPWILVFAAAMLLLFWLSSLLIVRAIKLLNSIPKGLKVALFTSIPLLFFMFDNPIIAIAFIVIVSLLGASIFVLRKTGIKSLTRIKKGIVVLGLLLGIGGLVFSFVSYSTKGYDVDKMVNAAHQSMDKIEPLQFESPATKGTYTVKQLTYGSGNDKRRVEYGKDATIKTESVNGVPFIDNWEGFSGWAREKIWGFDYKELPINGRVWYPEGDGPFPLALIVHGNHSMQDHSDPGYDYLGELLASRGIILASVDENFINGGWTNIFGSLDEENDARGWLLLEHLKAWHVWNDKSDNPFYKKIDTSNLAIMGHSRGGEAVAIAAMMNKLPYYPDDASIKLDYNFNIKSVVAIAPVDGQYKPGNSGTKFEDVNYFVIHGAQDADVRSFMGSQQYERIAFKDSAYYIKSGLYVYGANHGQFNSTWGNNDQGFSFTGMLNLKQLLTEEDQQEIAKVYISAFLDATLKNKKEYLPLFVDARKGKNWLPETIYLNQFEDSTSEYVSGFDEDFDVITTTKKGKISSQNLTVWREEEIKLKWQQKGSRALVVGWNYELEDEEEAIPNEKLASYSIQIDSNTVVIDSSKAFVFSMAESTESSNPKTKGKWVDDNENNESNDEEEKDEEETEKDEKDEEDEEDDKDKPKQPIDFSILFEDFKGESIKFSLSDFSPLQREIESVIMKVDFLTGDKESEKIFQTFYFPIKKVSEKNPSFDITNLKKITYLFDKSKKGVVVIDNVGFMNVIE